MPLRDAKIDRLPFGTIRISGGGEMVWRNLADLFSGSNDGTIICWDTTTGQELVRLMTFADGEWLALTPEGYYNASPGAEKYLRLQTPQGIFTTETHQDHFQHFHRPDIIAERLSR